MAMLGMDPVVVRAAGQAIQQQSDQVGHVILSAQGLLNQLAGTSAWNGADAQYFNQRWATELRPALVSAQTALAGFAQDAIRNANEQEVASEGAGIPWHPNVKGMLEDTLANLPAWVSAYGPAGSQGFSLGDSAYGAYKYFDGVLGIGTFGSAIAIGIKTGMNAASLADTMTKLPTLGPLNTVLGVVGVVESGISLVGKIANGNASFMDYASVGLKMGGLIPGPIGLGFMAFNTGWTVGEYLGTKLMDNFGDELYQGWTAAQDFAGDIVENTKQFAADTAANVKNFASGVAGGISDAAAAGGKWIRSFFN